MTRPTTPHRVSPTSRQGGRGDQVEVMLHPLDTDPRVRTVAVTVPGVATAGGFGSWRCFLTVQQEPADPDRTPTAWLRSTSHGPMWVTLPVDGQTLLAASMIGGTLTTADLRALTDDQIRQRVLSDVISVGARATHDEMSTARFADGYQDDPAEAEHFRLLTDRISRAFTLAGRR
jgi:hypothetical protein